MPSQVSPTTGGSQDISSIKLSAKDGRLAVPDEVEKNTTVRIFLLTQDADGLYAPDAVPTIRVEDDAGNVEQAFTNMTLHALGAGAYYYDWASGAVLEGKKFIVKWTRTVNGVASTQYAYGETVVVEEKTDLDAIQTQVAVLHDTRIPGVIQPQTGDSYARLGAPAGASIAADIAATKAETALILGYVDTEIAAVKAKTDNLPASPAVETTSTAIKAKTDLLWESEVATVFNQADVGSGATQNVVDKGADAGVPRYRFDSVLCDVTALGANTQFTFKLWAEIAGTLTQIGNDVNRAATGAFDLLSLLGVTSLAARHIRVTVVGNNAANNGTVKATVITSKSGA